MSMDVLNDSVGSGMKALLGKGDRTPLFRHLGVWGREGWGGVMLPLLQKTRAWTNCGDIYALCNGKINCKRLCAFYMPIYEIGLAGENQAAWMLG